MQSRVKTLSGLAPAKIGCGVWLTSGKQLGKEKLFSARPSCSPAISWNGAGCPSWDEPPQASLPQPGWDALLRLQGTPVNVSSYVGDRQQDKTTVQPCPNPRYPWSWYRSRHTTADPQHGCADTVPGAGMSASSQELWGAPSPPKEFLPLASPAWEGASKLWSDPPYSMAL